MSEQDIKASLTSMVSLCLGRDIIGRKSLGTARRTTFTSFIMQIISLLLLQSSVALSSPQISTKIAHRGPGCPQSTLGIALQNNSLTVIFDKMTTLNTTNCLLLLDISSPKEFRVSSIKADYRGYFNLPTGTRAKISANYRTRPLNTLSDVVNAPKRSVHAGRYEKIFQGPLVRDYTLTDVRDLESKGCSDSHMVAINIRLQLKGDGIFALDSLDLRAENRLTLGTTDCECEDQELY